MAIRNSRSAPSQSQSCVALTCASDVRASAELCARLVRRFATEPLVELLKLYRLLVFSWWTGNGDMHLKNFSLLGAADGTQRLAPAYDQLSTRLVIPNDDLALPVVGKKSNLSRAAWLEYADGQGVTSRRGDVRVLTRRHR